MENLLLNLITLLCWKAFLTCRKLQNKYAPGSGETGPYNWDQPSFVPDPNKQYYFQNPYTGQIQYVPYENQNFGMPFNGDPNLGYIGGPGPDSTFFKTPFQGS